MKTLFWDLDSILPRHADLHPRNGPKVVWGNFSAGLRPSGGGHATTPVPVERNKFYSYSKRPSRNQDTGLGSFTSDINGKVFSYRLLLFFIEGMLALALPIFSFCPGLFIWKVTGSYQYLKIKKTCSSSLCTWRSRLHHSCTVDSTNHHQGWYPKVGRGKMCDNSTRLKQPMIS